MVLGSGEATDLDLLVQPRRRLMRYAMVGFTIYGLEEV